MFDDKILDSTSMDASYMDNNVFDILSLRSRENYASNELA
jgi:hypothetical protein